MEILVVNKYMLIKKIEIFVVNKNNFVLKFDCGFSASTAAALD